MITNIQDLPNNRKPPTPLLLGIWASFSLVCFLLSVGKDIFRDPKKTEIVAKSWEDQW